MVMMMCITIDLIHPSHILQRGRRNCHLGHNQSDSSAPLKSKYAASLPRRRSKAAQQTGLQVGMLSGVKPGSSKISHLRMAITAADEMLLWQTVLLRHFVPFTHQLAVPWENGRAAGSLQH